jgi:hypothetical protein
MGLSNRTSAQQKESIWPNGQYESVQYRIIGRLSSLDDAAFHLNGNKIQDEGKLASPLDLARRKQESIAPGSS